MLREHFWPPSIDKDLAYIIKFTRCDLSGLSTSNFWKTKNWFAAGKVWMVISFKSVTERAGRFPLQIRACIAHVTRQWEGRGAAQCAASSHACITKWDNYCARNCLSPHECGAVCFLVSIGGVENYTNAYMALKGGSESYQLEKNSTVSFVHYLFWNRH